jgi:predicted transposase YdaD
MENKPVNPIPEVGNIYDKIIKENALELFKAFTPGKVWIDIIPLKDKIQSTLEREPDMLYEVTDAEGKHMLVHMEFQSTPDPDMHLRMLMYLGLISQKYKLPVWQLVIYLGTKQHRMIRQHSLNRSYFEYDIIVLNELDPERFLSSQVPEVLIFAVFAKFEQEQTEQVLRSITMKLQQCCNDRNKLKKYHAQLLNLARLRKFDHLLIENFNTMPIYIELEDVETDYLYNKGMQKGKLEGIEKGIEKGIELGEEKGVEKGVEKGILNSFEVIKQYKEGISLKEIAKNLQLKYQLVKNAITEAKKMGLI